MRFKELFRADDEKTPKKRPIVVDVFTDFFHIEEQIYP